MQQAPTTTQSYQRDHKTMPAIDELDRLESLPLTQLIVCGRSGSMVLHALLDGHPEILHIPHTFKMHDFLAAHPDFSARDGAALARAFVSHASHEALFDSERSVLLRGRLGVGMTTRVVIDKETFREAMTALLPGAGHSGRRILCAVLLAHARCLGISIGPVRHLFVHLHHGDWLWPDALTETCNLQGHAECRGLEWLMPERILVSVRNPTDTIRSIERFVLKAVDDAASQNLWMERYLRLLIQDWYRLELARAAGIHVRVVKLEELRLDTNGELERITRWMGISPIPNTMRNPTMFGLPWWGDTYSEPTPRLAPSEPVSLPSSRHADHHFIYSMVGHLVRGQGYPAMSKLWFRWPASLWPLPAPKRPWSVPHDWWPEAALSRAAFARSLRQRHAAEISRLSAGNLKADDKQTT